MKYLLGIDFGGGASKATLLCEDGSIAAAGTTEYQTFYPASGWAEQSPRDWYSATVRNIAQVLKKSAVSPRDIAALCLDAATHTAVLCDTDFNALSNSIYWTDSRSTSQKAFLEERYGDVIRGATLHSVDTIWTLPQLLWIKEERPEIWEKTRRIMFAKDYVRHQLTGDFVTDYIEAEGSMFFDYNGMKWSEELCAAIGLDISFLPEVVSPKDIAGRLTKKAALETGLAQGTPVLCGTTDTAMEVFAAGGVKTGSTTVKLATAGRICVITDKPYPDKQVINYSHIKPGLWYPGTATKSCAASLRWFRDTFGISYEEVDKKAAGVPIGADGLIFHPYLNGELTPYANPKLCGDFLGIRSGHTAAHFSRAVLEGVALSLLDCKNYFASLGAPIGKSAAIIGGGAKSALWRQITADVLGLELTLRENSDSSFGSAMLAGVAAGIFEGEEEALSRCSKTLLSVRPDVKNNAAYMAVFERYKASQRALESFYGV